MEAAAPSSETLSGLRSVARTGFGYAGTKGLAETAGWKLVDDEPSLGYLRYDVRVGPELDVRRSLVVSVGENGGRPFAFVPLFYFEEYASERAPLDQAYTAILNNLGGVLGPVSQAGSYHYPHRSGWPYRYAGWVLPDATLLLVQDEFDIQFGMDVTLWVLPAGAPVAVPVRLE